jgi:type IX secretion system PorP/SprF family membrane protein
MKNYKIFKYYIAFAILSLSHYTIGQDTHFSQYNMAPLTQNPAMAGAIYGFQANFNYRDQWRAIGAPYKTLALSTDVRLNRRRARNGFLAGGITFYNDKAGDAGLKTNQGSFNLAYHAKLDRHQTLGGGIQIGMIQRSIGNSGLQWGNQFDGTNYNGTLSNNESISVSSFSALDIGLGAVWSFNNADGDINVTDNHDLNFNFGISAFHINRPKYSFLGSDERLPIKFVAHGEGIISIQESEWGIVPGLMFYSQGKTRQLNIGILLRYLIQPQSKFTGIKNSSALYLGAYIRARDAIIPSIVFDYAGWSFGMSYDINISKLTQASQARGGLEFSLRFNSKNPFRQSGGPSFSRY